MYSVVGLISEISLLSIFIKIRILWFRKKDDYFLHCLCDSASRVIVCISTKPHVLLVWMLVHQLSLSQLCQREGMYSLHSAFAHKGINHFLLPGAWHFEKNMIIRVLRRWNHAPILKIIKSLDKSIIMLLVVDTSIAPQNQE